LAEEIVTGQDWLGAPGPPGQFRIRWDDDKDREQATKSRGPLRKPIKLYVNLFLCPSTLSKANEMMHPQ
jgi:hypothetical protein